VFVRTGESSTEKELRGSGPQPSRVDQSKSRKAGSNMGSFLIGENRAIGGPSLLLEKEKKGKKIFLRRRKNGAEGRPPNE